MPKLELTPKVHPLIKAIVLGYSKEGKSGATVALGVPDLVPGWPGLELRVLDFDGKYEEMARTILAHMLKKKVINQSQHDTALTSNFDICVCREKTKVVNSIENRKSIQRIGVEGTTTAWSGAVKQLQKWDRSWDDTKVLIIDSLTYAGRAAANFSQELNGKLNQELHMYDYSGPQQLIESLMVLAADIPAHTLVLAHQDPFEIYKKTGNKDEYGQDEKELVDTMILPISVGQAGRPKLPAQFNHMLLCDSQGIDTALRRYLWTKPRKGINCSSPFFNARESYPIEKGFVEYFMLRNS